MTPTGAHAGDLLDGAAIAATAAEMIRLEPLGGQEEGVLAHVAGWLAEAGVDVTRTAVPAAEVRAHPAHSEEIARDPLPVLVARVGGGGGRRLLLNAHVDVVPARQQPGWRTDPFSPVIEDGRLVGRGAADTLGGLAAAMHVVAALARDPGALGGEVVLTPVVGEEDGGSGTLATLLAGVHADGAVVIEPTGLAVARASAGALCFRVTVPGQTAHGSVRHTGVSAIEKGWLVHRAILALESARAAAQRHPLYPQATPFPICIGRIEGGDYLCDEAAWLVMEGRYGTAPDEPVAEARAALVEAVAAVAAQDPWLAAHPPVVEWIGAQWLGGDTPEDHPLVAAALEAARVGAARVGAARVGATGVGATGTGSPDGRSAGGVPYGCDMGLLRQVGDIPTVVYGPGDAAVAHAPDEAVVVDDLSRCARSLDRLARTWCR